MNQYKLINFTCQLMCGIFLHRRDFLTKIVNRQKQPVDVAFVIRQRLAELRCEQRELARAAAVTEFYISQLLTRKNPPGRCKGFGFVEMPDSQAAHAAIVGLWGQALVGRVLAVTEAKSRGARAVSPQP